MKIKVGDFVMFNEQNRNVGENHGFIYGKAYNVTKIYENMKTCSIVNEEGVVRTFGEERFELVRVKSTKNQRISKLEKEVEELKSLLKSIKELL